MPGFTFHLVDESNGLDLPDAYGIIRRMQLDTDARTATINISVYVGKDQFTHGKAVYRDFPLNLTIEDLVMLIGKFQPDVYAMVTSKSDLFPGARMDSDVPVAP